MLHYVMLCYIVLYYIILYYIYIILYYIFIYYIFYILYILYIIYFIYYIYIRIYSIYLYRYYILQSFQFTKLFCHILPCLGGGRCCLSLLIGLKGLNRHQSQGQGCKVEEIPAIYLQGDTTAKK